MRRHIFNEYKADKNKGVMHFTESKMRMMVGGIVLSLCLCACSNSSGNSGKTESTEAITTSNTSGVDKSSEQLNGDETSTAKTTSEESATAENLPPLNIINDKYGTTYEIFVYSFYDSDGDGIGDLQGVIDKLDYVNDGDDVTDTDLGCNAIWLMPISPSPTYHKYDVTDYMDIDPQYGTMEDFEKLIEECHKRGIRVITDLVLNHTSSEHPWFKEAAQFLRDNPDIKTVYTDRETMSPVPEVLEKCPYFYYYNFSNEEQTGYEKLAGTNWYYEARFWSGMPDLNLDNDQVKEEIAKITKFWLDKGVDGFRLDAVTSYYTDIDTKNIEFMTWLNDTIKSQKEDASIVAEAWTNIATYSEYYKSGIDSFFDFNFSGSEGLIASVARGKRSPQAFIQAMADAEESFVENNENYIDAPFYTNHDMARSAGYYVGRGSQDKVKLAGALNLLMGGNAFIYYGEELGMKGSGKDENKRAPMQWSGSDSTDTTGMCKGPADMDEFDMSYPALDEQVLDPYSIYNYYKKAIRLRNTYPVIARGKTEPFDELSDSNLGAFVRFSDDSSIEDNAFLILINNGDTSKTVDISKWSSASDNPELAYELNVGEETCILSGKELTIPSYGIAVVR